MRPATIGIDRLVAPREDIAMVLLVDDDPGILSALRRTLRREGYEILVAANARAALAKMESRAVDLVLSDVVMPKMDGYELYLQVKKRYPNTPVLMMTAFHYDKDHIIKRSRLEGLEGVIFKKPVDPDRLRRTIAESVQKD